jgi:hypothetical protein
MTELWPYLLLAVAYLTTYVFVIGNTKAYYDVHQHQDCSYFFLGLSGPLWYMFHTYTALISEGNIKVKGKNILTCWSNPFKL